MYPALEGFHDWLMEFPDRNWGFITYRCTYSDDKIWDEFMDFLKARVKVSLEDEGAGDIYKRLDWIVIEDAETLEGADQTQVKKEFKKFVKNTDRIDFVMSREHACIMVDEDAMKSIQGKGRAAAKITEFDVMGFTWVWLISREAKEKPVRMGMSYLMPRAYGLIEDLGWRDIYRNPEKDTSCP